MPVSTDKFRPKIVFSTADVAELLGKTKQTILNWLREGRILEPERNPANNYRMWSASDVERIRYHVRERQLAKARHR